MNKKKSDIDIREELNNLIADYFNGSFAQMVCEYIRATSMTDEKVEALLEVIRQMMKSK